MFPQYLFIAFFYTRLLFVDVILQFVMPCSFGEILASRAIRAAHCLTSIQVIFFFIYLCYVCQQKVRNACITLCSRPETTYFA
jgi:hypothetical protein